MRDRVFLFLFLISIIGLASMVLSQFYSVEALMLFAFVISGIIIVRQKTPKKKDLSFLLLMSIPLMMKIAFYYYAYADITGAILNTLVSIYEILNVLGLGVLIALGEESFRALVYELVKQIEGDTPDEFIDKSALLVSNVAWIILHFIRRQELITLFPLETLYYVIWLFVTGVVLTIIYKKCGLGYSALMHFLINSF